MAVANWRGRSMSERSNSCVLASGPCFWFWSCRSVANSELNSIGICTTSLTCSRIGLPDTSIMPARRVTGLTPKASRMEPATTWRRYWSWIEKEMMRTKKHTRMHIRSAKVTSQAGMPAGPTLFFGLFAFAEFVFAEFALAGFALAMDQAACGWPAG